MTRQVQDADPRAGDPSGRRTRPLDEPVVSLRSLSKTYHPTPRWMRLLVRTTIHQPIMALEDVDLELHAGGICAVVGPNGAGKTTMFRILTGLTTPSGGSARVLGLDADRDSLEVRRRIGWMPAEDRSLFLRLTCRENLLFHGRLQGLAGRTLDLRIAEVLEQVGLAGRAESSIFSLSAGMRSRVQLARALLHRPALIILDEPTGAVDPVDAHALLEMISTLVRDHRLAALISSHRLEEIEALHAHVILLDRGRIRYQGDLDDLRRDWDRPLVDLEFRTAGAARAAGALLGVDAAEPDGLSLRCRLEPQATTGDLLVRLGDLSGEILHVREAAIPLRDLLAQLYQHRRTAGVCT